VICYNPSASITVYGTGFAANEQYTLILNFQPVDDNFLQSTFSGTYTLPRSTVSIRSSSTSSASMLVFVLSSSDITNGAVDIRVSLQSIRDSRAFLNSLDLFPSLYGRSPCASVSATTGISISANGGTNVSSLSVSNGVYPKLLGSPEDWILRGVGLRSFQCVFTSRSFTARTSAFVVFASPSSSNVVGSVTFQCSAPVWLSSATAVRIFLQFQSLFLPVPFFIGSVNDFTIVEAISSVSPSLIPYNGGYRLTISGNGFVSDNSVYKCTFNNIESSVTVLSSTALSCLSPVLSLPASMVFSVKYAGGASVPIAAGVGNVALSFSASILSVLSPQVFIASASLILSIGGLSTIDPTKYRCVISFVDPRTVFELALDGTQSSSSSVKCDTSSFPGYLSSGQILGGSAVVTLKCSDVSYPVISGSAAVSFLGDITSITPTSSSSPSKFVTVFGNGFIPGVNTAQVCAFQSTSDSSASPITSATVGLTYTTSLICEKPSLSAGQYSLSILSKSQIIARTSNQFLRFTASAEWTSIAPDKFPAIGGAVFSIVGSSFSLGSHYSVKFYVDEIYHYVSVIAVPISATALSGYSPAWPFPASQVTVSVEFQGSNVSNYRQNVTIFPEISRLQTLPDFSGPFLYLKASGLSPVAYTCSITDSRTGLSIQTRATLGNATGSLPYSLRPTLLKSTTPLVVDPFSLLMPFNLFSDPFVSSPPFSPDFTSVVSDWNLKSLEFDMIATKVPVIFVQKDADITPPYTNSLYSSWEHHGSGFVSQNPNSFVRMVVKLSSPETQPRNIFPSPEGNMVRCYFVIRLSDGQVFDSSYSVILPHFSQVECSHSFRQQSTSVNVTIRVMCSSCVFRIAKAFFEQRQQPAILMPSTYIFGSLDIGCKSTSGVAWVAPFDSFESSAFRQWIALCVINNADTANGGAVSLIAMVNISSVNRQYDATALVSYRVLYSTESFLLDPRWSTSNSSSSSLLRKLWFLAEPVSSTVSFGNPVMSVVSASGLFLESYKVSKLDFTTLVCDTSSVSEGQKFIEVTPSLPSYFGLARVTLSVRVLPTLSVMSLQIPASGMSKFLFQITGLDSNFNYQLMCSFRSSLTTNSYNYAASSVVGSSSLFSCAAPAIDSPAVGAVIASWTFSASSATAKWNIVEPSKVLVVDQLRVNATNVDSAAGGSVPVSFAFSPQESFVCKLSAPLSGTARSLELVGDVYATIPITPSFSTFSKFSISMWIKASGAIKDHVWINVLSILDGFAISILHSGQSSDFGDSARIKFCANVSMNSISSEQCVYSTFLSITNVWTHIFAGVNGASGDLVLAVNNQEPYQLKLFQFDVLTANSNPRLIVLGSSPLPGAISYNGLIDNVRIFSTFISSNLVSELYQRSFSSYPPNNVVMSLTFDDDNGRDEISGQTISIQRLPFSSMKGQWYSDCIQSASGKSFSYSTQYNQSHYVYRSPDSAASSWKR
jgi:hypothetical protein